MTQIDGEERCIALTAEGNRCARRATEGQFCFQHDRSSPTVDDGAPDSGRPQCVWSGCTRTAKSGYTIERKDRSYASDDEQNLSGPVCLTHYTLAIIDDAGGIVVGVFALGMMFGTGLYGPTLPVPIPGQLMSAVGFVVGLVFGAYLWRVVVYLLARPQ